MKQAIGYTRVSTAEQGRSGLGLEAQRQAIEDFSKAEGITIAAWHQDVQTGKGADALAQRPGLRSALRAAKAVKGPLIVAKLDRLARNSHFITGLMEQKQRVQFIVTQLPQADAFTLQIYAALAEKEAVQISERTRAALARAKSRGQRFGMDTKTADECKRTIRAGAQGSRLAARARLEVLRPHLEFALKGGVSLKQAAHVLNTRDIASPLGGSWHPTSVRRAVRALGLRSA